MQQLLLLLLSPVLPRPGEGQLRAGSGRRSAPEVERLQCLGGGTPSGGVQGQSPAQQVQDVVARGCEYLLERYAGTLLEGHVVRQGKGVGPGLSRGGPAHLEYLGELAEVRVPLEEGDTEEELGRYAADGPDVYSGSVSARPEEELRRPVPPRDDLVGEGAVWATEGLGQTKVCDLEGPFAVEEEVVGLEVAVEYPVRVEVLQPLEGHEGVGLAVGGGEEDGGVLDDDLQVRVHVVEYETDVGLVAMDVQQSDDVGVVQLLKELDFPERGPVDAVHSVGLLAYLDFLNCYDHVAILRVFGFEDCGVLAFSKELGLVVAFRHFVRRL